MSEATGRKRRGGRDTTQTPRQLAHLERLAQNGGKRVLVDLDAEAAEALESLQADGYAVTRKGVVSRALLDARAKVPRKA